MRILLTNDDGIHAPGLELLEAIAARLSDDVWVCAPSLENYQQEDGSVTVPAALVPYMGGIARLEPNL